MSHDEKHGHNSAENHRSLQGGRLAAERAREILTARFTTAGMNLARDVAISASTGEIALDGYDQERRAGFVFVSNSGNSESSAARDEAGSVTQIVARWAAADERHILLVFEDDTPSEDALERRIDAFFSALPRT